MTDLRQAAQAVVDRWDSPLWKNGSTADAIAALRTALERQQDEPVKCPIGLDKKGASQFCSAGYCDACKQQQAEPVAFVNADQLQGLTLGHYGYAEIYTDESAGRVPLYTTPPQRKPLTNEQADQIISGLQTCHHQNSKREF